MTKNQEKPPWLSFMLEKIAQKSLDELILTEDGTLIGTSKKENVLFQGHSLKIEHFTRQIQGFSLSQGLRLDPRSPFSGGSLEGSRYRWQCVIPPVSQKGLFFLRKHRFENLNLENFPCTSKIRIKIEKLVQNKSSFLIAGPTGSGKSTLLHAILKESSLRNRVIFLEEYEEIPLSSPFWLRLLSKEKEIESDEIFPLNLLFKEALRFRPDQIVLGEIRSEELLTFLEACNSGHSKTCSTIHAGNMDELKNRIKLIFWKNGIKSSHSFKPLKIPVIFTECRSKDYKIKEFEELLL